MGGGGFFLWGFGAPMEGVGLKWRFGGSPCSFLGASLWDFGVPGWVWGDPVNLEGVVRRILGSPCWILGATDEF